MALVCSRRVFAPVLKRSMLTAVLAYTFDPQSKTYPGQYNYS